jgi:TonB family protein
MDGIQNNNGLLNVIANLNSRGESGRLQITVAGSRGAFFFWKGKLVAARMGPFSGFPAVNLAISLGEATLKFDSLIQPPASSFIAINERVLLKERFGIETSDVEPVSGKTNESEGPKPSIAIPQEDPLTKASLSPEASPPPDDAHRQPVESNINNRAGAPETRRTEARSRRTSEQQIAEEIHRLADQLSNQATEEARTTVEKEKSFERAQSIAEEEKPGQTSSSPITLDPLAAGMRKDASLKRCPKCNRVYSDSRIYCRYDSFKLVSEASPGAAEKPEAATWTMFLWILVMATFLVSGFLGYLLNRYISREPGTPAPINAESEQPLNLDQDQPVVEGLLQGKETALVKPAYPAKARSEGVSGKVTVAVLVNKQGLVISARALNGHPLLKRAAVMAARKAKFSPDKLAEQGPKVSGTITYTFK